MRDLNLEAALWNLFTSAEFFESAARECADTMAWFGALATSNQIASFGRNNQIYDKFKKRSLDFMRGAELARLGDYRFAWDISSYISGDVRGMMEQPLHSWMTSTQFREFEEVRISRLLNFASQINRSLHNAIVGADCFFDPDPECPERSDDDEGFPGDEIAKVYKSLLHHYKDRPLLSLPEPLPEYTIDRSVACQTGDEVPRTGVWYPATGLEGHSLTFAIKGLRMQPAYRVTKTEEERTRESGGAVFGTPETVAVATTWHPVIPTGRSVTPDTDLRSKAGQPCPKAGIWQPLEPGATQRFYTVGETMADLKSAYGYTVWTWIADR
jgi:hypothetical protein